MDLSSSYMYAIVKITRSADEDLALADEDLAAQVILFLQALFSQINLSLNERTASSSNIFLFRTYT